MQFLAVILAILEAIPTLDKWFAELSVAYAVQQREKNNVDFKKAMDLATAQKDTTALQNAIGSKLDQ